MFELKLVQHLFRQQIQTGNELRFGDVKHTVSHVVSQSLPHPPRLKNVQPKLRFYSLLSRPFISEEIKIISVVFVSQLLLDEEWAVPPVPHRTGTGYSSSRIGG